MTKLKQCPGCNKQKPAKIFSRNARRPDGLSTYCAECKRDKSQGHRNSSVRAFFVDLVRAAKHGSNRRGIAFEIDITHLEDLYHAQDGRCAISGIRMTHSAGVGAKATNISIDRIDNERGYEATNVQLLCRSINAMKLNMTDRELRHFLDELATHILRYREVDRNAGAR